MSELLISEATAGDLLESGNYMSIETGHVLPPAIAFFWPVNPRDDKNLKARSQWSIEQQLDILKLDPTTRFVKVVHAVPNDEKEIVSLGRWHHYTEGYQQYGTSEIAGAKDPAKPETWPRGLKEAEYHAYWHTALSERRIWQGTGECWILTTICTREPWRRRGAASMILEWGLHEARKGGVPAFLEAEAGAKGLYETHGFREVGHQVMRAAGQRHVIIRMRADP